MDQEDACTVAGPATADATAGDAPAPAEERPGAVASARVYRPHEHLVLFYESEAEFGALTVPVLGAALARGERVVAIATGEHRSALLEGLGARGAAARAAGELWLLDAAEALTRILVDDLPSREGFERTIASLLRAATEGGRRVQAFGEMVDLLWSLGNVRGALELETLWEELLQQVPAELLCAYRSERLTSWASCAELRDLCDAHAGVLAGIPTVARAEVCVRFLRESTSPSEARRVVRDTITSWGMEELADAATFVVSELATNAVLHARSGFTVSIERGSGGVRLSVGDPSPRMVHPPISGALLASGRGLLLVGKLSTRWGQEVRPDGKLVWAEFQPEPIVAS